MSSEFKRILISLTEDLNFPDHLGLKERTKTKKMTVSDLAGWCPHIYLFLLCKHLFRTNIFFFFFYELTTTALSTASLMLWFFPLYGRSSFTIFACKNSRDWWPHLSSCFHAAGAVSPFFVLTTTDIRFCGGSDKNKKILRLKLLFLGYYIF